tara:strand:+ start:177 stop:725 length:549 start_codon:yes stop_codon:yes gene_type:complete
MKKFLWILVLGLLLAGCVTYSEQTASDGTKYKLPKIFKFESDFSECKMDGSWYAEVKLYGGDELPIQAIADCYSKKETYEICLEWDYVYQQYYERGEAVLVFRQALSKTLLMRNEDPLKCRNPDNDAKVKIKKEVKKAKLRAAAAEADAAKARAEAERQRQSCHYETYTNINGATATRKVCK